MQLPVQIIKRKHVDKIVLEIRSCLELHLFQIFRDVQWCGGGSLYLIESDTWGEFFQGKAQGCNLNQRQIRDYPGDACTCGERVGTGWEEF